MNESERLAIATIQLAHDLRQVFGISWPDALRLALQLQLALQLYLVHR